MHRILIFSPGEEMGMKGWSGLYWARKKQEGDYEIRTVAREGEAYSYEAYSYEAYSYEAYSYPAGVFPGEAFERLYERVVPGGTKPGE